ncbi:rifin [Plasmodium falciparum IGH-CR14]|uniref:Rifin n=1 Tax=Plasmodium falciparum IGH-CR14 TaxID=580059 RepID=A0A0L1I960_PLAFA|nr:rifin [Plasmodium falciparum IGH-CR14]
MKVQYSKILLFALPLYILVSYYEYSKNKLYIKAHTATTTWRVLSESDPYMPNYGNDDDMKSVKEIFDRQTSQRFEEYNERIKDKRKKCKEQCDKDIQKIIEKDKIEKSLTEKVEKVCLRCGFGLGGIGGGVGIFGAIAVNEWTKAAMLVAAQKGIDAGIAKAFLEFKSAFPLETLGGVPLQEIITAENFNKNMFFIQEIIKEYNRMCDNDTVEESIFALLRTKFQNKEDMVIKSISTSANNIALKAGEAAKTVENAEIALANAESTYLYSAIGYSVLAILIILIVMFNKCKLYIFF